MHEELKAVRVAIPALELGKHYPYLREVYEVQQRWGKRSYADVFNMLQPFRATCNPADRSNLFQVIFELSGADVPAKAREQYVEALRHAAALDVPIEDLVGFLNGLGGTKAAAALGRTLPVKRPKPRVRSFGEDPSHWQKWGVVSIPPLAQL
jgi:hypothetical protein